VINDLGDNSDVTGRRSVVDEDNSADFDESLESGWLLGLDVSCVDIDVDVCIGRAASSFLLALPKSLCSISQPSIR